ncbi:MAG: hypothetical protein HY923_00570 [Elusimicrobia bacterium]|nr:hypothetical protein [Elusimicrobiota bacterium]
MKYTVSLLLLALSASALEGYPIRPVSVKLEIESDRIVADIETDSIYWIEEVAHLHPMPPADWPADARGRVQDYVNSHLRLSDGGRVLPGALDSARYRQLPWEVNEEGRFFLRMVYPPASGAELEIAASFFNEYRAEATAAYAGRPFPPSVVFRTDVSVPSKHAILTPESPAITIATGAARRGALATIVASLRAGAATALGTAAGFPALLAIALCVGGAAFDRRKAAVLATASALGFACAGALAWTPPWQIWPWTLATALVAGRWRRAPSVAVATASALGLAWAVAARPTMPHAALASPSALAGAMAGGAVLLCAMLLVLREEYKRMFELSESRVEELFARRVRLLGTILTIVGAYGLWQSIQR